MLVGRGHLGARERAARGGSEPDRRATDRLATRIQDAAADVESFRHLQFHGSPIGTGRNLDHATAIAVHPQPAGPDRGEGGDAIRVRAAPLLQQQRITADIGLQQDPDTGQAGAALVANDHPQPGQPVNPGAFSRRLERRRSQGRTARSLGLRRRDGHCRRRGAGRPGGHPAPQQHGGDRNGGGTCNQRRLPASGSDHGSQQQQRQGIGQAAAQLAQTAVQSHPHRHTTHAEPCGNGCRRELVEQIRLQHFPVVRRQGRHGPTDFQQRLAASRQGGDVGGSCRCRGLGESLAAQQVQARATALRPSQADQAMAGERHQPRHQWLAGTELLDRGGGGDPGVLNHLVELAAAGSLAADRGSQPGPQLPHQLGERELVATTKRLEQLLRATAGIGMGVVGHCATVQPSLATDSGRVPTRRTRRPRDHRQLANHAMAASSRHSSSGRGARALVSQR